MKKNVVFVLLFCLALSLVGCATSQSSPARQSLRLKRPFRPVAVSALEGPTLLEVGQYGLFMAVMNVETATLPLQLRWDLGDGTKTRGLIAQHRYAEPGTYTVTFTASNQGSADSDSMIVTVQQPVAMPDTTSQY